METQSLDWLMKPVPQPLHYRTGPPPAIKLPSPRPNLRVGTFIESLISEAQKVHGQQKLWLDLRSD